MAASETAHGVWQCVGALQAATGCYPARLPSCPSRHPASHPPTRVEADCAAGADAQVLHPRADSAADLAALCVALPHIGPRLALGVGNAVAQVRDLRRAGRQGGRAGRAGRQQIWGGATLLCGVAAPRSSRHAGTPWQQVASQCKLRKGAGQAAGSAAHIPKLGDAALQIVIQGVDVVVGGREGVHQPVRAECVSAGSGDGASGSGRCGTVAAAPCAQMHGPSTASPHAAPEGVGPGSGVGPSLGGRHTRCSHLLTTQLFDVSVSGSTTLYWWPSSAL